MQAQIRREVWQDLLLTPWARYQRLALQAACPRRWLTACWLHGLRICRMKTDGFASSSRQPMRALPVLGGLLPSASSGERARLLEAGCAAPVLRAQEALLRELRLLLWLPQHGRLRLHDRPPRAGKRRVLRACRNTRILQQAPEAQAMWRGARPHGSRRRGSQIVLGGGLRRRPSTDAHHHHCHLALLFHQRRLSQDRLKL
mmetsp:Transcript_140489/g.261987  ORF Transcript_140489/g.261987 Transcript_140489/m.261987 type:complete len:201 (-) Transcript_140489:201-803(-)